jgi:curved DNA-binding protein CbpA
MTGRNPWVVLGVAEDALHYEVQRAHRRRVKQTHPDRGGDGAQFAAVAQAFEAL